MDAKSGDLGWFKCYLILNTKYKTIYGSKMNFIGKYKSGLRAGQLKMAKGSFGFLKSQLEEEIRRRNYNGHISVVYPKDVYKTFGLPLQARDFVVSHKPSEFSILEFVIRVDITKHEEKEREEFLPQFF